MNNLTKHPCAGKCTNFKNEPCNTCLIGHLEDSSLNFTLGDAVVLVNNTDFDCLLTTTYIEHNYVEAVDALGNLFCGQDDEFRSATSAELKAKHRVDPVALFVSSEVTHV